MEFIIPIIIGLLVGAAIGYFLVSKKVQGTTQRLVEENNRKSDEALKDARIAAERTISDAKSKAERIVEKAEEKHDSIKQRKVQEAKEKYSKLRADFESERANKLVEVKERELEIAQKEKDFKSRMIELKAKTHDLENKESEIALLKENLDVQNKVIQKKREELDAANEQRIKALEKVAQLSQQEAKDQLLEMVRAKSESEAMVIIRDSVNEAKLTAGKEAKKIIIQTIQRMAAEHTIENTVSVFHLDSDDMKGQIIGREGRNIRALEAATGVELIVDDTPEAIVISSFDPVRREVARLSLQRLVADGRIHPARIEEIVAKTRKQMDEQIIEIGERVVLELDIHGLNPNLLRMVGRMRFRSSYGQNLLKHSSETAKLCAIMAAELGLSKNQIKLAKRAGLLHDIGKVAEEETELSHALLGKQLCEQYKEHPAIVNAVGAHHDEIEMNNIISPIVQTCDAISGARPGARREILESYMKRIGELEEIAMGHDGVSKAFAMQAGRELRVIVEADKVSDQESDDLSFKISSKIQDEMQFPGQIRVTVIRERRSVSYAR